MSQKSPPDQESDIADNPLLSRLDTELRRATKRSEWILWVGIGIAVAGVVAYERAMPRSAWIEGLLVGVVLVSIATHWIAVVRRKRAVASRYGLVCTQCGHAPAAHRVMSAAMTLRCEKCRATLSPSLRKSAV